jgi:hypothetical protein
MTGNDKEFREQLGKFRLDSGPAAASLSLPRSASPPAAAATSMRLQRAVIWLATRR